MGQIIILGMAAGAASALLVAGVAAGTVLAVPLFYLAPLPIMLAGLAFTHWAALMGLVVASAGLGLVFGSTFLLAYVFGIGGPAWVIAYCALLARSNPAARDGLTWFPVNGLVLISAAISAVSVGIALVSVASDYDAYIAAISSAFEAFMEVQGGSGARTGLSPADASGIGAMVAKILPPTAGALAMVTQLCCLYLAGKAAQVSGRLTRPWPDLAAWRLPSITSLALAVLVALSVVPGMLGLTASVGAATLVTGYMLAGFAVLHFLTRGTRARLIILTAAWVSTLALGWPALLMALLGLVDAMFDLRTRMSSGGGPPAANDR